MTSKRHLAVRARCNVTLPSFLSVFIFINQAAPASDLGQLDGKNVFAILGNTNILRRCSMANTSVIIDPTGAAFGLWQPKAMK